MISKTMSNEDKKNLFSFLPSYLLSDVDDFNFKNKILDKNSKINNVNIFYF